MRNSFYTNKAIIQAVKKQLLLMVNKQGKQSSRQWSLLWFAILCLTLLLSGAADQLKAQTTTSNLATQATASASTTDPNGVDDWSNINNGVISACGSGQECFIWGDPGQNNMSMQWEWSKQVRTDEMVFHHEQGDRTLTGFTLQSWDGSQWVDEKQFSSITSSPGVCSTRITFQRIRTDKIRLTDFKMTDPGQQSNPNFREIEIIKAPPLGPPTAKFVAPDTVFTGVPNLISNRSEDATSFTWYVDGNNRGSPSNLLFQPSTPGTKTISLAVSNPKGSDSISKSVVAVNPSQAPVSKFVADKNVVDPINDRVNFRNVSEFGPATSEWRISPARNPDRSIRYFWTSNQTTQPLFKFNSQAVFRTPGFYDVTLITSNSFGFDTLVKEDYIRVRDYTDICNQSTDRDTVGTLRDVDGTYPANVNCSFVIQPCANTIDLNLSKLELKQGEAFLRIYDGNSANGKPLWDVNQYGAKGITGDTSNPGFQQRFQATSGAVFVQFESGSSPEGDGFRLGWNGDSRSVGPLSTSIQGDTAVCQGQNAPFTAQVNAIGANYEWYLNKQPANAKPDANGANFSPLIADGNNDTLSLVISQCGRQDTITKVLTPRVTTAAPQVRFTASQDVASVGDTIQLAETTDGCVAGRSWGIAPNTYDFVKGTDAQSKNPEVVFNANGVYTVSLTDTTNGNAVATNTKSGLITIRDYCNPSVFNLNTDIGISNFALDEINNASAVGEAEYTDYTGSTPAATLEKGGTVPVSIERNTAANPISYRVWIDFNRDGDFTDGGETVYAVDGYSGTVVSDSLTVPSNVSFGAYRLRVGANLNQQPNQACGPNRYGEYEDYRVQVIPDQKAPVVLRRGGDTVQLGACNSANRFIRSAFARDIVDGRITNLQIQGSVDTASPGFYSIDYAVTDANGNDTTLSQVFEVLPDNQGPSFQLNGPSTYQLGVNQPYVEPGYSNLMDNCAVSGLTVDSSGLDRSELGTYTLTYTATDVNNNQTVKTREVAVVDTVAPDAELTGSNPLTHSLGTSFSDPGLENLQDNYWSAGDLTVTTIGKVDDFNPGEYELTYRVEDGSGNVTRLSRTVVVEDQTAPTVESTFGDTLALQVNTRIGEVTDQLEISDNFSSAAITNTGGTFYQQFPDGEATRLGTYSLRFEVADDKGNTTTATYTVKVVDRIAPEISLIGPAYTEQPRFDTTAYEAVDSVRVSDNYYTNRELEVTTSGSYFTDYKDTFSRGAYDLTYTVRDPSGNTASVTRTIAIIESTTGIAGAGEAGAGLTVYPNPTEGQLQVALSGKVVEDGRLTVLNALGQQVRLIQDGRLSGSYQVDLSGEQAGMYIIQLRSDDHTSQKRIVLTE